MLKTSLLTACTVLFLSAGAFAVPGNAASNSSYLQACSTQWQGMKSAGTVPAGMKWSDFLKTCSGNSASQASAPPQPPVAATLAAAKPGKKAPVVAAAAPATKVVANGQTFMQACSAQWKTMKSAGTVPAGMKWTDFLKTCSANPSGLQASATPAPVSTQAPAVKLKAPVVAARAAGGSNAQGKLAEQSRIKECGAEWKAAKAANTIPAGQTWPQFWSGCDARLKG